MGGLQPPAEESPRRARGTPASEEQRAERAVRESGSAGQCLRCGCCVYIAL